MSCSLVLRVLLAVVVSLSSIGTLEAQTVSFIQRLSGPAQSDFGRRVALEGDVLAVGVVGRSPGNFTPAPPGYVQVYRRTTSGTWSALQQVRPSDGRDGDQFGVDLAISGTTLVIGATGGRVDGVDRGAAYVFEWNGTAWVQQAKLTPSDGTLGDLFGQDVDIDGNIIVVGARNGNRVGTYYTTTASGSAYVFERSGGTWTQQRLPEPTERRAFGASVAISGNTICVGMIGSESLGTQPHGNAFVYARGGFWSMETELRPSDLVPTDAYGTSCDVEDDTIVVGADRADAPANSQGAAYVFARANTTWALQQKLTSAGSRSLDLMGRQIVLNGDWLALGAPAYNGPGGVFLFERTGTIWTERQRVQPGTLAGDGAGDGVAFDARYLVIGSPGPSQVAVYSRASAQGTPPGTPRNFQASVIGNVVQMSWDHPNSGGAPTGYVLRARAPNGALLVTAPLGLVTNFNASAPNAVYQLTVQATNPAGSGQESTSRTVTVPAVTPAPGTPTNLTATVSGDVATFTWSAPTSGGPPTGYVLVAGTTPAFAIPLASVPLPATPGFTVPGVPAGTYYVRVLAQNGGGTSAASNEVSFRVAAPSAPGTPTLHAATVTGSTVGLSWSPGAGGTATSYLVVAALTAGGPAVATIPVSGTSLVVPGVPSGTFHVRVVAQNAVGTSAVSNEVAVVVPQ
jgi:FG-GAP repeat/Fibronectin type III domain